MSVHILQATIEARGLLPEGAMGIDAGLTLTKFVRAHGGALEAAAVLTPEAHDASGMPQPHAGAPAGVTGARAGIFDATGITRSQEIEAAAHGARALMATVDRRIDGDFVLALLGTGTAFAAVRGDSVQHLGGTALGGGSFAGIVRRINPAMTYDESLAAAARGDRRRADVMVSDAYPEGIGRIGADMTAAHVAKAGAPLDDFMAGLLNLHGESIGQIAAGRALVSQLRHVVIAGGFAHGNPSLVEAIVTMCGLFGVHAEAAPWPGYAGAVGAALIAVQHTEAS